MINLFSSVHQRGIEFFLFLIILGWIWFFVVIIKKIVKSVKVDNDLQHKKKEKEIELLQAQIDSLKEEKGT